MPFESPIPPTEAFRLVHVEDSALEKVPGPIMMEYEKYFDIRVLEKPNEELDWGGLASLPVQPTIATCVPLKAAYRTIAGPLAAGPGGRYLIDDKNIWSIFANHTTAIENWYRNGQPFRVEFEGEGPKRHVSLDMWEDVIGTDYYGWIATVIAHKGMRSADYPFSQRGTWLEARQVRARARRRVLPAGAPANDPANESSSE